MVATSIFFIVIIASNARFRTSRGFHKDCDLYFRLLNLIIAFDVPVGSIPNFHSLVERVETKSTSQSNIFLEIRKVLCGSNLCTTATTG
jgi:hypothetical protein